MSTPDTASSETLRKLLRSARPKRFPRGQIILYAGDAQSEIFVLKTGVLKIYDIDEQGNEKILHIVKAPSLLPFDFFSQDDSPMNWFYAALTDCEVYMLNRQAARTAMSSDYQLTSLFVSDFSREVHELLVRLSSLGKSNTRHKLLAALKYLAVCHAQPARDGWYRVDFPVSHQLLADLSGITRESAAMVMKEFKNEKLIRNPRQTVLEIDYDTLFSSET